MKVTVNLAIKPLLLLGAVGLLGASFITAVYPLVQGDYGAMGTLALGALFLVWGASRIQGHLDDRIIRHYWLTQGYNTEAADAKVKEFDQCARDAVKGGTFFKEYGP